MSIIYEALKKVEKVHQDINKIIPLDAGRAEKNTYKNKIKSYFFYGAIYTLVALAGFFLANATLGFLTRISQDRVSSLVSGINSPNKTKELVKKDLVKNPAPIINNTANSPSTQPHAENAPSLVLTGLFFSDSQGYALINNRILKEGDEIEGATVKRISLNEVELESRGSPIRLSTIK